MVACRYREPQTPVQESPNPGTGEVKPRYRGRCPPSQGRTPACGAKSSDFAAYAPRAVDFDPDTFSYSVDPEFSHEAWQYELERARRNGSSMTSEQRTDAYRRQGDEMRRKIMEFVISRRHLYKPELDEWMRSQGMAKNKAQSVYSSLVESGALAKITEHVTSRVIVGTPDEIRKMYANDIAGRFRI